MNEMEESILTSVKKLLGIADDYTEFDLDITMHINSALAVLTQLGIGPDHGFAISDKTSKWINFFGTDDPRLNMAKSYVAAKVRKMFDPPTSSAVMESLDKQISEFEWRLNVHADHIAAHE